MFISTRITIGLFIFSSALIFVAGLHADDAAVADQNARWSKVEAEAAKARKESESRVKIEAEAVARREAEAWEKLNAEKSKSVVKAQKAADMERKIGAARAERDLALEQAKTEAAPERARAKMAGTGGAANTEFIGVQRTTGSKNAGKSSEKNAGSALLWYIPNRLSDLMDIFTVEVGIGELGLDLVLTRYASFGAGVGVLHMLGWSINNQHGIYRQDGWYAYLLNRSAMNIHREKVCGNYASFTRYDDGRIDIGRMDAAQAEDPYAIGLKAGCYLNLNFQIHVTELADFIAGIFFIDFKEDDKPQINWVF